MSASSSNPAAGDTMNAEETLFKLIMKAKNDKRPEEVLRLCLSLGKKLVNNPKVYAKAIHNEMDVADSWLKAMGYEMIVKEPKQIGGPKIFDFNKISEDEMMVSRTNFSRLQSKSAIDTVKSMNGISILTLPLLEQTHFDTYYGYMKTLIGKGKRIIAMAEGNPAIKSLMEKISSMGGGAVAQVHTFDTLRVKFPKVTELKLFQAFLMMEKKANILIMAKSEDDWLRLGEEHMDLLDEFEILQ